MCRIKPRKDDENYANISSKAFESGFHSHFREFFLLLVSFCPAFPAENRVIVNDQYLTQVYIPVECVPPSVGVSGSLSSGSVSVQGGCVSV